MVCEDCLAVSSAGMAGCHWLLTIQAPIATKQQKPSSNRCKRVARPGAWRLARHHGLFPADRLQQVWDGNEVSSQQGHVDLVAVRCRMYKLTIAMMHTACYDKVCTKTPEKADTRCFVHGSGCPSSSATCEISWMLARPASNITCHSIAVGRQRFDSVKL